MLKRFKKGGQGKPEEPEVYMPDNKDENTNAEKEGITGSEPEMMANDSEQVGAEEEPIAPPTETDENQETDGDSEPDETSETDLQDAEDVISALQKELSESHDKYLRLAAEFDNYRKRTIREKSEMIQTAGESLLIDVLPVMDDFERGLQQASKTEDMDAVKTGMDLIYSKLKDFLTNHGVKEI